MIYFLNNPLKVERIQKEVAKGLFVFSDFANKYFSAGMSESYYESGPQSVSQIVISLCTGQNKAPCISLRLVGYCFVDSFYVLSHLFNVHISKEV